MNPFNRKLALLLPALCLALPAFGAGEVLLTMDPDKGIPTFVDDTNNSRVMEFLSVNYQNPASPESFVLVFTSTFAGQYNTDLGRYTEGVVQGPASRSRPPASRPSAASAPSTSRRSRPRS
jgi:hypothetical protein